MRGKVGLVIGLGVGYVLGTRAGRERYEQIKQQAIKVWNLDPVQEQVSKATEFAKSSAFAVPRAAWDGVARVAKSVSGDRTPGQKLDSAIDDVKQSADDVKQSVDDPKPAAGA